MTALQKVSLGTPPTGTDGDTVRVANTKANSNVDVLNTQATLTSSSPNAVRDLTAADMGKRINFTPTAAATVHFPAANTTGADQIVSVHNLSTAFDITMAITAGSGDTAPTVVVVKPGEMLTYETDGVSTWRTIGRKKALDEAVQGKLSVTSDVTVGGKLSVTGQATFTVRPTFNQKTPWDTGNLANPLTADGNQTITGKKLWNFAPPTNNYQDQAICVFGPAGNVGAIGFASNANAAAGQLMMGTSGVFSFVNYNNTAYASLNVLSLTQASDKAFKSGITPLREVLPLLREKQIVTYRHKIPVAEGGGLTEPHVGVIAQDWQSDFPELVTELSVEIDEDGDWIARQYDSDGREIFGPNGAPKCRRALGFNYANASSVALKATQELDAALQAALTRIAALEGGNS